METNQLVIFGGAQSHGNLVDNDLYLLKLSSNETNGKWVKVPIKGERPNSRYGHQMIFFKPFILLIGGNIGNEPCKEVWCLSIERQPFFWSKINFEGNQPQARVYHAVSLWKGSERGDMILMFGGRNSEGHALNDLWGLRRHGDGKWDWIPAPIKQKIDPQPRYQHSMVCCKDIAIFIGGRNNNSLGLGLDVYDLNTSEWFVFPGINRFRHVSWVFLNNLMTHGGFENDKPNQPINKLTQINLKELFQNFPKLVDNIDVPFVGNKKKNGQYNLSTQVLVGQYADDRGMRHFINLEDLSNEPMKMIDTIPTQQKPTEQLHIQSLYQTVLKYFLKPKDWKYTE